MAKPGSVPGKTPVWQVSSILVIGVFCVSTAAIFIRLTFAAAGEQGAGFSLVVASLRLVLASLALLPTWRHFKTLEQRDRAAWFSAGAGVLLAIHFATWITSLAYTSIAASATLVTTNPVWVALLSWLWFRERLSVQTLTGIAITLAGGVLIALQDLGADAIGSNPLLGNFLALGGSWAISIHFLLGREAQRRGLPISQHVAIAYTAAALVLLPLPLLFGASYGGYPPQVYLYILLMAIVSQLMGHTSLNWAVHQISPTLVTLAILLEPIGSSVLGYFVFGEVPGPGVVLGGLTILVGVAIAALGMQTQTLESDP